MVAERSVSRRKCMVIYI